MGELAHIFVKRIPGTVEAEDQVARHARDTFGDPLAFMLVDRGTSETPVWFGIEDASSCLDGDWTEQRDGGHFGERGKGKTCGSL